METCAKRSCAQFSNDIENTGDILAVIQRAGRLIRPQAKLVLSMNTNPAVEEELLHYVNVLQQAA